MSSPESKIFCERLRAVREKRGLSQADLASRSDLQPSAVSHFETGRRAPSFHNLRRLADTLEVTIDYLLGRVDDEKAVGPSMQRIFRDASRMSKDDLDILADMAERLASKGNKGSGQ